MSRLYNGAQLNLAAGLSGKVFRAALLIPGPATFDATDEDVDEVLSHARNTARVDVGRIPLVAVSDISTLGIQTVSFRVRNNLYAPYFRSGTGSVLVYQFVTDDEASPVLALATPGNLLQFIDGGGFQVSFVAGVYSPTGVIPGTYGAEDAVGQFTVASDGRLTFADDIPISL